MKLKKFILKFRYYLALLFIITTISNVTLLPKQLQPSDNVCTISSADGKWLLEYQ